MAARVHMDKEYVRSQFWFNGVQNVSEDHHLLIGKVNCKNNSLTRNDRSPSEQHDSRGGLKNTSA